METYKFSDIHPGYAIFDNPMKFNYVKKWYESKNSMKFKIRRRTYIKATIISDFLKSNFVAPNLSTTHIKFNKKCTDYIENIILNRLGFTTIGLFHDYIENVRNDYPLCDSYVEIVFNAILSMSDFSKWLRANNYRIRMR